MKTYTKILLIIGIILSIVGITFVSYGFYKKLTLKDIPNPVATMEIEDYGTIKIELYPDKAQNTVANFIALANNGFYNDLTFHRTIPDFMIQGGDKAGNGSGSPTILDLVKNNLDNYKVKLGGQDEIYKIAGNYYTTNSSLANTELKGHTILDINTEYNIPGEFIANNYTNTLKHDAGVISMARTDYSYISSSLTTYGYNSAGSQFFIMTDDNTSLNGVYAGFGKVIEGMDVVEKVSKVEVYYRDSELKEGEEAPKDKDGETIASDTPKKAPKIKSVSVETYGVDYGIPKTVEPFDYTSWLMEQYGYVSE